jgi:hypothetical protein
MDVVLSSLEKIARQEAAQLRESRSSRRSDRKRKHDTQHRSNEVASVQMDTVSDTTSQNTSDFYPKYLTHRNLLPVQAS